MSSQPPNSSDSAAPQPGSDDEKEEFRTEMRNGVIWGVQRSVTDFGSPFRIENLMPNQIIERFTRGTAFEGNYGVLVGVYSGIQDAAGLIGKLLGGSKSNRTSSKVRTAATFMSIAMLPALVPIGVMIAYRNEAQLWPFYISAVVSLGFATFLEWTGNVCHSELLSRLFTTKRRGRITGISAGFATLLKLLAGWCLVLMLGESNEPMQFVWVSLIGVAVLGSGALIISFCREIPSLKSPPMKAKANIVAAVRTVWSNRRYCVFLLSAVMKYGFYAGYILVKPTANRALGLPPEWEGIYVMIEAVMAFFLYPLAGYLADKIGRGPSAMAGGIFASVGMVMFAHMDSKPFFLVSFVLMFIGFDVIIGRMIYLATVELSPREGRGTFVAARYVAESGSGLVFKPLVGTLFDFLSKIGQQHWAFYMCASMGLLTGFIVHKTAPRETLDET
jgi:hypothetical protein